MWAQPPALSAPEAVDTGGLTVETTQCDRVVPQRLGDIVELELSMALDDTRDGRAHEIEVRCNERELSIRIHDALTDKEVARHLPALRPDDPDPSRTAALAVAQLFIASWGELSTPPPPDQPPLPATEAEARRAVEAVDRKTIPLPPPRFHHGVGLEAGLRWRNLGASTLLPAFGIRYAPTWRPRNARRLGVGPTFVADFEFASSTVPTGLVQAQVAGGGAGVRMEARLGRRLVLEVSTTVAGRWQRLAGRPTDTARFVGDTLMGGGVDTMLGARLGIELRNVVLWTGAEGGYLAGGPIGRTPDATVSLAGPWLGVRLGGDLKIVAKKK